MKTWKWLFIIGLLMFVASLTIGCENPVGVSLKNSPDLRIRVWDTHYAVPYENAFVQVYLPEGQTDGSHTGSDGWTQWLLVPRDANGVQISISYHDRNWKENTIYRWVPLHRGDNEPTYTISTYAP